MNKFLLLTICFLIGISLFYLFKTHCSCWVVEGQNSTSLIDLSPGGRATNSELIGAPDITFQNNQIGPGLPQPVILTPDPRSGQEQGGQAQGRARGVAHHSLQS